MVVKFKGAKMKTLIFKITIIFFSNKYLLKMTKIFKTKKKTEIYRWQTTSKHNLVNSKRT